ncbi:MAG: S-adenosylmethionine:tRNA ribosyltransferase-isomerase [Prevotella sp.]|nr:S-adenosylmethionine:tRNA ribosyltransferase-isomerase [Prevotella sp.]
MEINPRTIRISDYNYPLPDERIAKFPKQQRDQSKLLIYDKGRVGEDVFANISHHLPEGALMVFNNTKVIQARLHFRKSSGALIEVFLLEPAEPADYEQMFQTTGRCSWLCLVGNLKKWKEGPLCRTIEVRGLSLEISATRKGEHGTSHIVEFSWSLVPDTDSGNTCTAASVSFAEVLDAIGELPIPPYLNRDIQESDKTTYQTVYSKIKGSVAAPTAGLHFTDSVLSDIDAHGIEREELTLHVGAGTFRPVKSEQVGDHPMHTEYIAVKRHTIERLISHGGKAIAVGTTSVRTLESLYYMGLKVIANPDIEEHQLHVEQWEPYDNAPAADGHGAATVEHNAETVEHNAKAVEHNAATIEHSVMESLQALLDWMKHRQLTVLHSSTQIIIAPGYEYKIVNMLITNFHQPQSTLLLLVSAFVKGDWHTIYDYALAHDFRFLSYGDSSLLIP